MKSSKLEIPKTKQYQNPNVQIKTFGISYVRTFFSILISVFCILGTSGCNSANEKAKMLDEIEQLKSQNKDLTEQVENTESRNKQLKDQVKVLTTLPEDIRAESLYNLESIKIGRYTDFFDKDHNGKKETLIVYIQPSDDQGDKIKASGTVEVELWDLNKPDGHAMLSQWKVEPEELKKCWFATLITINYRLTFDITDIVEDIYKPLTVKVKFTDYLSGKTFEDQKVIKP